MELRKSKVYIKTDAKGRITRCEGGYTTPADLTGWTYIDEGTGDKYNLCQNHYFAGGLRTSDDIPRYKLADGKPILRTDKEIKADRAALPAPQPSEAERRQADTDAMIVDHEYRLTILELGVTEEV